MNEFLNLFLNKSSQLGQPNENISSVVPFAAFGTILNPDKVNDYYKWLEHMGMKETPDYDMKGFYDAMTSGTVAGPQVSANDGLPHFTDKFKTPEHESFSSESKFARPGAPSWNELDQLVNVFGGVNRAEVPGPVNPNPMPVGVTQILQSFIKQ